MEEVEAWVKRVAALQAPASSNRGDPDTTPDEREASSALRLGPPELSRMATTGAPELASDAASGPAPAAATGEHVRAAEQHTNVSFVLDPAAGSTVPTGDAAPAAGADPQPTTTAEHQQQQQQEQSPAKPLLPREYVMRRVKFQPGGVMIPEQPAADADKSRSRAGYYYHLLFEQIALSLQFLQKHVQYIA